MKVDTSKNSRAANSACLFGRLDSGLFPVRFLNVRKWRGASVTTSEVSRGVQVGFFDGDERLQRSSDLG